MALPSGDSILDTSGPLNRTLPGLIRDRLPEILSQYRDADVRLLVTTQVDMVEEELGREDNFYVPARGRQHTRFTWKAAGPLHAVMRRFRLEFLRYLTPADMRCEIFMAIWRTQEAISAVGDKVKRREAAQLDRSVHRENVGTADVAARSTGSGYVVSTPASGTTSSDPRDDDARDPDEETAPPRPLRSAQVIDAATPQPLPPFRPHVSPPPADTSARASDEATSPDPEATDPDSLAADLMAAETTAQKPADPVKSLDAPELPFAFPPPAMPPSATTPTAAPDTEKPTGTDLRLVADPMAAPPRMETGGARSRPPATIIPSPPRPAGLVSDPMAADAPRKPDAAAGAPPPPPPAAKSPTKDSGVPPPAPIYPTREDLKEPGLEPRAIDSVDSQSPVSEPAAPETPRSETSSLQLPIPPIPSEDENSADGAEDQKADTAVSSSDPIKPTREQTPTAKDATAPSDSPTPPVSHAPRRVDSTPTPPMPTREARKEITEALSDIISAVERSAVEEAAVTRPTPPEHADESKTETPAEQSAAKAAEPDAPPKPAEAKPASTPKRIPEPEAADAPPRPRRATPTAKPTNDDYVRRAAPLPGNFYQDWFGFEHMPFNNTPDPGFFFPTEKHQEALSRLIYAISERKGFVLITGEIGSGKSTLCRTLLAQLPRNVKTALITHTHIDPDQLVKAIAEDLGLDVQNANKYECLQKINECLIEELAAGNTVCIIIDEAQNLSPAALEEVRMISNLETEREKLVQLILLGQPELRDKVNLPSMLQLRQRISVQYHLQPLTHDETVEYISHRLRVAAPAERLEFERRTMHEVYNYTGGIPRLINTLCDNALLTAYTRGWRVVSPSIIREAAADLELQPLHGGWRAFCRMW